VETIVLQTGAACGCMATVSNVRVCRQRLQLRLKTCSCLWCSMPLQSSSLLLALCKC